MPEQNNIDKLFQDKLKGLKASPSPKTWVAIENKMAPKKRRVVPFWWFSGIAGILILGFFLFPFYEKQDVIVPNNSLENNFTSTEKETILNNIDTVFSKHLEKENTQLVEKEKINANEKKKEYFNNKQTKPLKQEKEMSVKKIAMREKVFPENLAKNENQENENKTNHQQKEQTIVSAIAPKQQNQKNPETNSSENTIANKEVNLLNEGSESESNNKKKKRKTWSISTNFALLNSGSFSNTSPFSENLSNTT
jgi:outer membrane biosynthesis protein TonB